MEATPNTRRFNRFLPYTAVLQADLQQTLQSWLFRGWVILSIAIAIGYVLYRFGAYREAGMIQPASQVVTDLVRWLILGSVTLIIVLTAGCISSERGTLADSILSRGISRYQYFLGKWHARMISVLGTFFLMSILVLVAGHFLLRDHGLTLTGSVVALINVTALLAVVITFAVSVSAMTSNSLVAIAVVWVILYGGGFLLSLIPPSYPSPERVLRNLPNVIRGMYDWRETIRILVWAVGLSTAIAGTGLFYFSRRDV